MASEPTQTIARLTPLADVLALIAREVRQVVPRDVAIEQALHATLAADVVAKLRPTAPLALIDGWALASELTRDAGGYAPAPLPRMPPRVDAGQPLPQGADCVAPLDTVVVKNGRSEVLAPAKAGDGVLARGADSDGTTAMRRTGERLRAVDVAALSAAGETTVSARVPRLRVVAARSDTILANVARLIANDAARHRAAVDAANGDFAEALDDDEADAIMVIGGTGSGTNDRSVQTLADKGRVVIHGIGLSPGETAAFGFVGVKPVLLLPGRLDAALAVWLTVGRYLLWTLAGATEREMAEIAILSRKVTSTVGLAEFVPVRRADDKIEPLATKYLPFSALVRSHGWILVPADSEGYSAGAQVPLWPWP
jgi:molybdopterin biosynthesis enzyme